MDSRTNRSRTGATGSGKYRISGSSSSYAARTARAARSSNRRKKLRYNYKRLAVASIALIALLGVLLWGITSLVSGAFSRKERAGLTTEAPPTTPAETELTKSVMIDDINITGMSRQEAHDAVLSRYSWGMQARLAGQEDKIYEIDNIIELELNEILDEIFGGEPRDTYEIKFTDLDGLIQAEADKIAAQWNVKAKNAAISSFDADSGKFTYVDGTSGVEVDMDQLIADITKAIEEKNFKTTIDVRTKLTSPEIATKEQVKEMYKVIGTFTTNTTVNKDRNTNISLACLSIDGKIIQPGEEFSFNKSTGNRTLEKGYKPAGAYLNGVLIEEPGGGVCQVSSTLYNAVVFSGLTTTERHAHSFVPSYVTPGEDAMVSYDGYDGPDMKFVNNSASAVAVRAKLVDQKLTVSIIGLPILAEDEKVYMHSEKVADYDVPPPSYEEDPSLAGGVEVMIKDGTRGSRWVTNLVRKKGDAIVSDTLLHTSTYRGNAPIMKRNSTGATVAAAESTAESTSQDAESSSDRTEFSSTPAESRSETTKSSESISSSPARTSAPSGSASTGGPGETTAAPSTGAPTQAPSTAAPTTPASQEETIPPNPGG